jgi:formamidopyrimidine-DNA glycosylase
MPELPEVETMVLGLRKDLLGRTLSGVRIFDKSVLRNTPARLLGKMRGARVISLKRKGKFLVFRLSNGAALLFHLKMTGRLLLRESGLPKGRWERLQMEFDGWKKSVFFVDPRRFGYLAVDAGGRECPVPLLYELGPDALAVSRQELEDILAASRRPVKALLLDQRSIAGLGNIYVDESLHRAGIHPAAPALSATPEQAAALYRAMRNILRKAVECGGSSVRNYRDSRGSAGSFQRLHRVYGKQGEKCRRCGSEIEYAKIASRGTHFCPACQKKPAGRKQRKG